MPTLIDSYSESNVDTWFAMGYTHPKDGHSFTVSSGNYNLTSCKFYLRKCGSPTGYVRAKLYAITGTYGVDDKPTGTALATSNDVQVSTFGTSGALVEFTFSTPYEMQANTHYFITAEADGFYFPDIIQDGYDGSSPTHTGCDATGDGAGAWTHLDGYDMSFYVYGEATAAPFIPQINYF